MHSIAASAEGNLIDIIRPCTWDYFVMFWSRYELRKNIYPQEPSTKNTGNILYIHTVKCHIFVRALKLRKMTNIFSLQALNMQVYQR